MTDQNHNLNQDESEGTPEPRITELVAYLDGELPEQDADRIERLLQANAVLRSDAEALDRTWKLLDSLEDATASRDFTQKTLASVSTVSAGNDTDQAGRLRWSIRRFLPWPVILRGLIWCLAGFLACSAGLTLSRKARRERTDPADAQILKDLDLYRQYPKLWRIPDVGFLQEISADTQPSATIEDLP